MVGLQRSSCKWYWYTNGVGAQDVWAQENCRLLVTN